MTHGFSCSLPIFQRKWGDDALLSYSPPKFAEFEGDDAPDGLDDSTHRALMSAKRTLGRGARVLMPAKQTLRGVSFPPFALPRKAGGARGGFLTPPRANAGKAASREGFYPPTHPDAGRMGEREWCLFVFRRAGIPTRRNHHAIASEARQSLLFPKITASLALLAMTLRYYVIASPRSLRARQSLLSPKTDALPILGLTTESRVFRLSPNGRIRWGCIDNIQ